MSILNWISNNPVLFIIVLFVLCGTIEAFSPKRRI